MWGQGIQLNKNILLEILIVQIAILCFALFFLMEEK